MPFLEYIHTYAVAAALVALLAMVVAGAAVGAWRLVPKRLRGMPLVVFHQSPLHHLRQAFAHRLVLMMPATMVIFSVCAAISADVEGLCDIHGRRDKTKFHCSVDSELFKFEFAVDDATVCKVDKWTGESDVDHEDRAEIFFSSTADMIRPYYALEIDRAGRVHDYRAVHYRKFDSSWNFRTLMVSTRESPGGYAVSGSIVLDELKSLGLGCKQPLYLGVFKADWRGSDENSVWASAVPQGAGDPDFHRPGVLFRAFPSCEEGNE